MKILICGDRNWKDYETIEAELAIAIHEAGHIYSNVTVIHGAARGADILGALAGKKLGVKSVLAFEADWKGKGRAAGPIRNSKMLDMKPDLVLAFHDFLPNSKGTRDTVEKARKLGIKVKVIGHER